jgi:hypothetical protein
MLIALLIGPACHATLIPTAFAAQSTVTIESQTNSSFDYSSITGRAMKDLNTPSTGSKARPKSCIASTRGKDPHGHTYILPRPATGFVDNAVRINSILM